MTVNTNPPTTSENIKYLPGTNLFEEMEIKELPFQTYVSLVPLIKAIERRGKEGNSSEVFLAKSILKKLEGLPELRKPLKDIDLIEKHKDVAEMMMLFLIPPAARDKQLVKISPPFSMKPLYFTPALEKMIQENEITMILPGGMEKMYCANVIKACTFILNRFYDQHIEDGQLISLTVNDQKTGLTRYFKTNVDLDYIEIEALKPLKPLSQQQINELLSNIYDINLWLQYLPPENFAFHGFTLGQLTDITEEESLSRIKFQLLGQDAVMGKRSIEQLQKLLQTYFRQADLRMGITAIDYPRERAVSHRYRIRFDFLAHKHECLLSEANANSIYEKVCRYDEILLIEDLEAVSHKTPIEKDLLEEGIKSIIVAPLKNKQGKVIGILEIGSPNPFQLHSFIELKFKEIVDLFAMAVERSRDEVDNRIEAIIREKYTAVHPSVEWKFIENAFSILESRENEVGIEPLPIIFEEIYPLYGQADIVGSSDTRNDAIQADMRTNLQLAGQAIKKCLQVIRYPLLKQLLMYIERDMEILEGAFNSSDESRIISLLQEEVHPVFKEISDNHQELSGIITSYFAKLDPEFQIVYKKRRAYEDSVSKINRTISKYLEEEQIEMQRLLPHYFEKYKTDGVEYDLYIGQSLLRRGRFSETHLQNFRLWQLIHMCEITRIVEDLQPKLDVPLKTAQLIFAYTNSLSIRFRMDEKQFDVDGAYNVRYEILKKRIDKATINGTDERLTQAGKVAIVYLQDKDRQEYLKYFDYLMHEGYIEPQIEELDINRLQSVQGLKALRVTVRKGN